MSATKAREFPKFDLQRHPDYPTTFTLSTGVEIGEPPNMWRMKIAIDFAFDGITRTIDHAVFSEFGSTFTPGYFSFDGFRVLDVRCEGIEHG